MKYKKRQARTNELEFMESLNEHGMIVIYRRVLAQGDQEGMRIRWGTKGILPKRRLRRSATIPVCLRVSSLCIQPTAYTQEFGSIIQEVQRPPGRRWML